MLINAISTNSDTSFETVFQKMFGKDTTMADLNRAIPEGKKIVSRPVCKNCGSEEMRTIDVPRNSICIDGNCDYCDECGSSQDYR